MVLANSFIKNSGNKLQKLDHINNKVFLKKEENHRAIYNLQQSMILTEVESDSDKFCELKGLSVKQIDGVNKVNGQSILGRAGECIFLSPEARSMKVDLGGVLHHFTDAALLRERFFLQKRALYFFNFQGTFSVRGNFFIISYVTSIHDDEMGKVSIELQSDGEFEYEEINFPEENL